MKRRDDPSSQGPRRRPYEHAGFGHFAADATQRQRESFTRHLAPDGT